jgi:hypothetical protein
VMRSVGPSAKSRLQQTRISAFASISFLVSRHRNLRAKALELLQDRIEYAVAVQLKGTDPLI